MGGPRELRGLSTVPPVIYRDTGSPRRRRRLYLLQISPPEGRGRASRLPAMDLSWKRIGRDPTDLEGATGLVSRSVDEVGVVGPTPTEFRPTVGPRQ